MPDESRPELDARLAAIEARLAELESRLAAGQPRRTEIPPPTIEPSPTIERGLTIERPPTIEQASVEARALGTPPVLEAPRGLSAALVLGWAGAAALVLAAAYLVRLGIESGWITPARQVLAAGLLGLVMVAGGLALRIGDRPYASLLSAGGVAVLYVAIFAAHLYHHLIGAPAATALAVAAALLSLALHALHRAQIYVAFALAGSYATPLLVEGRGSVADLALYLAVWDLVYCAYGIWTRRRLVVVAALYASLLVFDVAWAEIGSPEWEAAALFQLFQFVLFVGVAVALSVRLGRPMGTWGAILHFPALLLFYVIEYAILDRHAPDLAPWAAIGFALALYAAWGVARGLLAERPGASLVTIHGFGALVLLHAVYLDATPETWRPLAALALAAAAIFGPRVLPVTARGWWPYWIAAALLLLAGYVELLVLWGDPYVGDVGLALAYPALLYILYFERPPSDLAVRGLLLAAAHALLLSGCALLIERWLYGLDSTVDRLWLSLSWGSVAIAALLTALARKDRLLARSSLGIFLLFGFKVLVYDLDRVSPLVRVGILAVLGVSLYAGGWIYRRVLPPQP